MPKQFSCRPQDYYVSLYELLNQPYAPNIATQRPYRD